MERTVLFQDAKQGRISLVRARHFEPLQDGTAVSVEVEVTAELMGCGWFDRVRLQGRRIGTMRQVPSPDFLVATVFQVSTIVNVLHYGRSVQETKRETARLFQMPWSNEPFQIIEPIFVGGRTFSFAVSEKSSVFKGFPVTPERQTEIRTRTQTRRNSGQLFLESRLDQQAKDGGNKLRHVARLKASEKGNCYFPKQLVIAISEPAVAE